MKALSWIAAPLRPLQLASGQKSFRANPLIGSAALNRRGLHLARVRIAERMASTWPTSRSEIYRSLRRNPFLPFTGLHVRSLPGLKDHLSTRQAQTEALLSLLGAKRPWVEVAPKRITDPASIWAQRQVGTPAMSDGQITAQS